jgi:hypothetical protein
MLNKSFMRKTFCNRFTGIVILGILFCGFSLSSMAQGTLVKNSTIMKIASGTTVVETIKLTMESGSSVDNSGTIIIKGNLENQNSSQTNLGAGTFEFSGTSAQTISGLNQMNNVTVNNPAGVVIGGNTEVDGVLTLTSGLVTLGSNNLLLGPVATIGGTPASTKMIVATGTGQLQKQFTDGTGVARSFTFPVGDNTGTAEYSPVTLNFTTGNFASGIAGVKLVNSPWTGLTGDYLNRYWVLSQSNISSFSCNARFDYLPADIVGSESNIYCIRVEPIYATFDLANVSHYLTASGLTSFSTFSGGHMAATASLSVFLQGPYNITNHNMNNTLATALTLGDRSDNTKFPNQQPYNGVPWNYAGTESVSSSLPSNVVDWVLVELRHGSAPATATAITNGRAAGFVLRNGSIVSTDGSSALKFLNLSAFSDNLYPVIYHRNHLVTMANSASSRDGNQIYNFNFVSGDGTQMYGLAKKQVETGIWAMMAGDADHDKQVQSSDFNLWSALSGFSGLYTAADFALDGSIQSNDFNLWSGNSGFSSTVP